MLVTLSIVVCLLSDPKQCLTVEPMPGEHALTVQTCPIAGQIEGALWIMRHPGYRVSKVHCTAGHKPKEYDA